MWTSSAACRGSVNEVDGPRTPLDSPWAMTAAMVGVAQLPPRKVHGAASTRPIFAGAVSPRTLLAVRKIDVRALLANPIVVPRLVLHVAVPHCTVAKAMFAIE